VRTTKSSATSTANSFRLYTFLWDGIDRLGLGLKKKKNAGEFGLLRPFAPIVCWLCSVTVSWALKHSPGMSERLLLEHFPVVVVQEFTQLVCNHT